MSKTGFFRNFLRSLKKSNYFKLVGEDNLANKYFESISADGRNTSRWVEPPGVESDRNCIPHIPVEWTSWLQRRRNYPPTLQELDRNEAVRQSIVVRSRQLLASNKSVDGDGERDKMRPYAETVEPDTSEQRRFPERPGFQTSPGYNKGDK